ncbi:hypothetical protein HC762_01390 [bacterium]|nr:hypothetical protein [bacterium]
MSAQSKFVSYSAPDSQAKGVSYSVNVPSSTAQSGTGPIYIQLEAPAGVRWLGLGQGRGMAGANILIIYSSGSDNVTVSPRLGRGEFEPDFNPEARVTLLDGSGISSDGAMTANLRCDSCITWNGGSLNPTDTESNWIWAIKFGDALESTDVSEDLSVHDIRNTFSLNLRLGASGDSDNPFAQGATITQSAGTSQSASPGEGEEEESSESASSSSQSTSSEDTIRKSHGVIMAVIFLFLFPIGALMIYLPFSHKVLLVHAPLQALSTGLLIAGLVLGVILGKKIDTLDEYHQIVGYVIVGILVLFEPVLGMAQHLRYRKSGKSTIAGSIHRWLGRIVILAGIVNGGLGFRLTGAVGSENVPTWSVIAYSAVAGVMAIFYLAVVLGTRLFRKRNARSGEETKPSKGSAKTGNGDQISPETGKH